MLSGWYLKYLTFSDGKCVEDSIYVPFHHTSQPGRAWPVFQSLDITLFVTGMWPPLEVSMHHMYTSCLHVIRYAFTYDLPG
jgi:hypothetical protein